MTFLFASVYRAVVAYKLGKLHPVISADVVTFVGGLCARDY